MPRPNDDERIRQATLHSHGTSVASDFFGKG